MAQSEEAQSYLKRLEQLSANRVFWEPVWLDCIKLGLPLHSDFTPGGVTAAVEQITAGPKSEERGRKLYDGIGAVAVDRLASGMESLVTPQSEKWHGLQPSDLFGARMSDEEREYFELYRDYLFMARYQPKAGFVAAHQKAMRSTVALGTGVTYLEEAYNDDIPVTRQPFQYCNYPITKCYLAAGKNGVVDTLYFMDNIPARALAQKHQPENLSARVRVMLDKPETMDTKVQILHAVQPRTDRYQGRFGIRNSPFQSAYIEVESKHLIGGKIGGFYEFPFNIYHWQQSDDGAYGESALMMALGELKQLQIMGKTAVRVHSQMADPPTASYGDGMKYRVNMNPRANNPGMVNAEGKPLILPIHTAQLPQVFNEYLTGRRDAVADMLYIKLFQILVQNPNMTATEAMIRANEKGELLGPAGSKIQSAMAQMVDRETAILDRMGVYDEGSPLQPPKSLAGRNFGPVMTSPLDRLRRAKELLGTQQLIQMGGALAQIGKITALDNLDEDQIMRDTQEIAGAPARHLKRSEEVAEERKQKAAMVAQQQQAEQLRTQGEAAKSAAEGAGAAMALGANGGAALADAAKAA